MFILGRVDERPLVDVIKHVIIDKPSIVLYQIMCPWLTSCAVGHVDGGIITVMKSRAGFTPDFV